MFWESIFFNWSVSLLTVQWGMDVFTNVQSFFANLLALLWSLISVSLALLWYQLFGRLEAPLYQYKQEQSRRNPGSPGPVRETGAGLEAELESHQPWWCIIVGIHATLWRLWISCTRTLGSHSLRRITWAWAPAFFQFGLWPRQTWEFLLRCFISDEAVFGFMQTGQWSLTTWPHFVLAIGNMRRFCLPLRRWLGAMFQCRLKFPSVPLPHTTGCCRPLQPSPSLLWHPRESPAPCNGPWQSPVAPALPVPKLGPHSSVINVMPYPTPWLAPKVLWCQHPQIS